MTREEFFVLCKNTYGVNGDYPFNEDFETAVFRHTDNKKWFALLMRIPRSRLGINSDDIVDVVNLKQPIEMLGSFTDAEGVYPAYHMNKLHWVSVILQEAPSDVIELLLGASFELTSKKKKRQ